MPDTWVWVPIDGAHCRDGSGTGISVNVSSAAAGKDKLMIFLQGGGACFNSFTCGANPANSSAQQTPGATGIYDRTNSANPVKDWNFVNLPYCTGDVFSGNNPKGSVPGVSGTQMFVGYANMALFLKRIIPTFPGMKQVLLTGVSAGGFGAAANFVQVAKAFGSVPVVDLDDSGPPMDDPYDASCLQDQVRQLWDLDSTVLAECGSDCPDKKNYQTALALHAAKEYPNASVGLVDDTGDGVISGFFGFGQNNCTGSFGTPISKAQYTMGLDDLRTKLAATKWASFIFDNTVHTTLSSATYYSRTAGGVLLTDWVTQLLAGTAKNEGPP
jgi:hypothetical protein